MNCKIQFSPTGEQRFLNRKQIKCCFPDFPFPFKWDFLVLRMISVFSFQFSDFSFQFSIFNAIQSWWWLHSRKYVQMKLFFNKCFHHSLIILMSYFLRFVLYNTTEILHDYSNCFSVKHPLNFSKSLLQVFFVFCKEKIDDL